MWLKRETYEEAQYFLTLAPVSKEWLGAPATLDHHYPWVHPQEEKVSCATNMEAMTLCWWQSVFFPDCIASGQKPTPIHWWPTAILPSWRWRGVQMWGHPVQWQVVFKGGSSTAGAGQVSGINVITSIFCLGMWYVKVHVFKTISGNAVLDECEMRKKMCEAGSNHKSIRSSPSLALGKQA